MRKNVQWLEAVTIVVLVATVGRYLQTLQAQGNLTRATRLLS